MRDKSKERADHLRLVDDAERQITTFYQERAEVIAHLSQLTTQMRDLQKHYETLIQAAMRYHISNTELARAMGKTEGAVRMYKKRKGIK